MKKLIASLVLAFALVPAYADKEPETKKIIMLEKQ